MPSLAELANIRIYVIQTSFCILLNEKCVCLCVCVHNFGVPETSRNLQKPFFIFNLPMEQTWYLHNILCCKHLE